nr:VCBS repeat-containing protein [bacterium]
MRALTAVLTVVSILLAAPRTPAADFDGDGRDDIAVFRPATGLWSVRGFTRVYFGSNGDTPSPGDYNGDGIADFAVHRSGSNLWAARGVTRVYYGNAATDVALTGGGGGGQRLFDYSVRPGDGADLEAALESDEYDSVFVPAGSYNPTGSLTVDHVTRIVGESKEAVSIYLPGNSYLAVASPGCTVEGLTLVNGGFTNIGNCYIGVANVTVRDCRSRYSVAEGFLYTAAASGVTLDNCNVAYAGTKGFAGNASVKDSKLINCSVADTSPGTNDYGFEYCNNLVNCYVNGEDYGYRYCNNVVASTAYACRTMGFYHCNRLSSCYVDGNGVTLYGMQYCNNLAATTVENCDVDTYQLCNHFSVQTWGSCD